MKRSPGITLAAFFLLVMLPFAAAAQDVAPPLPQGAAPVYTQQQLDQLVAPIALYPDPLLGQILMASTYPLEVVEAYRWQQANSHVTGDQLQAALAQQPWDPSVKSLVPFPHVLAMMDGNLQWTEQLGNAFLANQPAVMGSVQQLRQMAQTSGNLQSTPQQMVVGPPGAITIEPANPDVVYVPTYNPTVIYGAWPWAAYPPYYFPPPPGYVYASVGLIGFGFGIGLADWFWGWDSWDWHDHRIDIDRGRFEDINRGRPPAFAGDTWAHDPAHRHGVPYASPVARAQFQGAANQARQNFRGYEAPASGITNAARRPSAASFAVPRAAPAATPRAAPAISARPQAQQRTAAPVYESFSRGADVRAQSQRGSASRSSAPAVHYSAPSREAAPSGGGSHGESHGGGGNGRDR
jgi:hypothetical protein